MSEGDVSLINDEDLLRRMWQQTEDFSRKKEIRAHMYRLREERLRNLYSPEPTVIQGKGCEFTGAQGHVKSFADQNFQSMKSKEVRDAGSPPRDFYRGQDLKELSNAGWNVESENRTTDDGHTHVRSVHANIEGRYDVEGGKGQFAAVDQQKQAVTEYDDGNTSLKKNESSSKTAAREQVVRQSDDGTHFSSTSSTSTSSSKIQQISSTKQEEVPRVTDNSYLSSRQVYDANSNEENISKRTVTTNSQNIRNDLETGELLSRKIDYPDDNTKIIVETRCLPDGTRVTSTRREFRAPAVVSSHSEHHSQHTQNEMKTSSTKSSHQRHDSKRSIKITNETSDRKHHDIVDTQRKSDENDFKKERSSDYLSNETTDNNFSNQQHDSKVTQSNTQTKMDSRKYDQKCVDETDFAQTKSNINRVVQDNNVEEMVKKQTSEYQTTYQSDYAQKKISNDWSPTQQAWASSLRADSPSSTRSSSRGSSPTKTFQTSTTSLRSSVSPDKLSRRPPSRGSSPNKSRTTESSSSIHTTSSTNDTKTSTYTSRDEIHVQSTSPSRYSKSPERKPNNAYQPRSSESPEKRTRVNDSPINKQYDVNSLTDVKTQSDYASSKKLTEVTRKENSENRQTSPFRSNFSPEKTPGNKTKYTSPTRSTQSTETVSIHETYEHSNENSDRVPGYMKHTAASQPRPTSQSPDRKPTQSTTVITKESTKLTDEKTKIHRQVNKDELNISRTTSMTSKNGSRSQTRSPSPSKTISKTSDVPAPSRPSLKKDSRSPSPPKGPVTFNDKKQSVDTTYNINRRINEIDNFEVAENTTKNKSVSKDTTDTWHETLTTSKKETRRSESPAKNNLRNTTSPLKSPVAESTTKNKSVPKDTTDTWYETLTTSKKETRRSESPAKNNLRNTTSPLKSPVAESTTKNKSVPEDTTDTWYETLTTSKKQTRRSESPAKNNLRNTTSPLKSPVKDKYYTTTDFITSERKTEQSNKRTVSKDNHRQLLTPSSSPTRKPKVEETEPSTGQSSPTTSVSGFIYISSSRPESTIVTDLDDDNTPNDNKNIKDSFKRPDGLGFKRSPSPSKIPCRSPSLDKQSSPNKDTLPRKSSLKKTSVDNNEVFPKEKHLSDIPVSTSYQHDKTPQHKIVKKDRPDRETSDSSLPFKPPLERRETYEERCRKILGMVKSDSISSTNTIHDTATTSKADDTNQSSPSVSPCGSPGLSEDLAFCNTLNNQGYQDAKESVHSFISREKTENMNSTLSSDNNISPTDTPTKLKDIISKEEESNDFESSTEEATDDILTKTVINKIPTITPTKKELEKPVRRSTSPEKTAPSKEVKGLRKEEYTVVKETTKNSNVKHSVSKFTKIEPQAIKRPKSPEKTAIKTSSTQNFYDDSATTYKSDNVQTNQTSSKTISKTDSSIRDTSRTPSPSKVVNKNIETNTEFIATERENEILEKVQKSLRKLSPERVRSSPGREKSPTKINSEIKETEIVTVEINKQKDVKSIAKTRQDTSPSKVPTRNVSPTKKSPHVVTPVKNDKKPENLNKTRSISPKKTITSLIRPSSPQISRINTYKTKEPMSPQLTRKCTSESISTKVEKNNVTDVKKTTNVTKQSLPSKAEPETRKPLSQKGIDKENVSPRTKKDVDIKVTRTTSDISIKPKKTSPQRIKSKPEMSVNVKNSKQTSSFTKTQNLRPDSNSKLPNKPKSATALNTSEDEDGMIIDVQQAKSSRENSPDRICPTPINFLEDVGTPRLPDEVSEPDDDYFKRTHQTIHETESLVDDIVEICEDEELFEKRTDINRVDETDESLLSVNDKVSKFSKNIDTKTSTTTFKDNEIKVHSDYLDENLRTDECLLSVSEKVNKFAKGPETRDKSPSRKITDEYDYNTDYQDNYTKLSVNDKAHLFIETAENVNSPKTKSGNKVERPDLSNVDDSIKSDDCLLSVSDKVNKFVKTAEQFLSETYHVEENEKKIKEQHDDIMKKIMGQVDEADEDDTTDPTRKSADQPNTKLGSFAKETASSHAKSKDYASPNIKTVEKIPTKITTLRSSEAVKKAKALFENIASSQKTQKGSVCTNNTTKLTDIGIIKKSPKTDSTIVLHPSLEDGIPDVINFDERDSTTRPEKETHPRRTTYDDKPRSPTRPGNESKSHIRNNTENTSGKTVLSRYPVTQNVQTKPEKDKSEKPKEPVSHYQRPTQASLCKEEVRTTEDVEVSTRRGSGKFGVELRRTSAERSTVSSERRRSSDHHQPCIEDIYDVELLEQMLEKVVGYEQRRRIRAQIRIAKKRVETENTLNTNTYTKSVKQFRNKSPDHRPRVISPERHSETITHTVTVTERVSNTTPQIVQEQTKENGKPLLNGHSKLSNRNVPEKRTKSPEKPTYKTVPKTKSPVRQPSPEKRTRNLSPSKVATQHPKPNRFNEYASAYMKKVGLTENEKLKVTEINRRKEALDQKTTKHIDEQRLVESKQTEISKNVSERSSSKDVTEVVEVNRKRSVSPEKRKSPERASTKPSDRLHQRTPSPDFKRPKTDASKETIIKTVYEVEKKLPKHVAEEKPTWVTNRNLKKVTSETRTYTSKKMESEKLKCRAPSPSKVISKPLDVITSSYGPGPLDADGRPLFGIKALRNGASNYQVKGTVIRQELHSCNGSEPSGSVSLTAYASRPVQLQRLPAARAQPAARLHGLAAITTTARFGGDSGATYRDTQALLQEERAALDQFTHQDRRVNDTRIVDVTPHRTVDTRHDRLSDHRAHTRQDKLTDRDTSTRTMERREEKKTQRSQEKTEKVEKRVEEKKTVRQSSVKSLTEKYIKNANETSTSDRSTYPKAGLILRTATLKDSVSSDSSAHGLARTDSEHSLGSVEDTTVVTTTEKLSDGQRTTVTTTRTTGQVKKTQERSFLDSTTKVTGVQDILTRMKNADIVIEDGDSCEDAEARALLNKFLGATVLMAGMQGYVTDMQGGRPGNQETVRISTSQKTSSVSIQDIDQCWDERVLKKLLDECTDYEQRRRLRARIRTLMAEQEACANAVSEALESAPADGAAEGGPDAREEEEVTVTSSVRRNSSEKTVSSSSTTNTSKVVESLTRPAPKPVSPFAKFRQLEKQNSTNTPNSPKSPKTPQSPGSPSQPFFKFTDPALQCSAVTIKERLLQWCRDKTRDYENVKLENFSTSWADGLAFCALVHHFLPDAFDYSQLTPDKRRHNFTLAFKVADEKAGIYPLLDVDDMVAMRKPDWKCVFTYVQSIHRRFKDQA